MEIRSITISICLGIALCQVPEGKDVWHRSLPGNAHDQPWEYVQLKTETVTLQDRAWWGQRTGTNEEIKMRFRGKAKGGGEDTEAERKSGTGSPSRCHNPPGLMPQLHQPEPGLSLWWGRGSRKWTTLQSRELGELKSLGVWSLGHFFSLLRTFFKKDSVLKKKKSLTFLFWFIWECRLLSWLSLRQGLEWVSSVRLRLCNWSG